MVCQQMQCCVAAFCIFSIMFTFWHSRWYLSNWMWHSVGQWGLTPIGVASDEPLVFGYIEMAYFYDNILWKTRSKQMYDNGCMTMWYIYAKCIVFFFHIFEVLFLDCSCVVLSVLLITWKFLCLLLKINGAYYRMIKDANDRFGTISPINLNFMIKVHVIKIFSSYDVWLCSVCRSSQEGIMGSVMTIVDAW